MSLRHLPADWITRLSDAIVASLQEFVPLHGHETFALFAVDCHPWHGMIGLAMVTSEELVSEPFLAEPAEMAAWRHYNFAGQLAAGKLFIPLGEEMFSAYDQFEDKPTGALTFLEACAIAATSSQVTAALGLLNRESGFRVSVTHPDSDQEFVVPE
jgi:hypothetical protein